MVSPTLWVDKVRLPFTESHSDQFDGMYTNQRNCKVRIQDENLSKAFYRQNDKNLSMYIYTNGNMEPLITMKQLT